MAKRAMALAALLLLGGCVPRLEQPEVWLGGVRLASIGLSGGTVDVRLNVFNPNRFALNARGLTYAVQLEDPDGDGWLDFTEGTIDRELHVGGGDTLDVVIPVEFTYRGLGQAIRGVLDSGSFDYRVSGVVALEDPVQRAVRYSHTGTVTPSGVR